MPDRHLVVIGEGPERARIERKAPPNVRLLGKLADAERNVWLAGARAFVFAANEDFGIAPLEAHALGTPVIAYAGGGASKTIRGLDDAAPTGVLFDEQSISAVAEAIRRFERHASRIDPAACRANAGRFGRERFQREFRSFMETRIAKHQARYAG